jgi:hypothetical protein
MKRNPLYLALLLAILVFAGNCRKSEISLESQGILFSISGRVLDSDEQPVGQALVRAGTTTAMTDVNGYFRLNNVRQPNEAAYVKVEKSGYFPGSRTFVANAQTVNYVRISLIPKELTGSFNAGGGGSVNLPAGGSISFQPGGIVDAATNSSYNGMVNVSAFFIDPTAENFTGIMPGDLRGITSSNEERGLKSFGMMAVELTGTGGQKLQLASGKPATMSFAIHAGLRSQAPASIPLWYFDEEKGFWKEEGSATKQGDMYVGTVSHFSFWNCDAPFQLVRFEAQFKDQNGNPIANAQVKIKKLSDSTFAYGITDSTGKVKGLIPANEALSLKLFDRCRNALHSQNIGPYSGSVNLGTITVNVQPQASVIISGTVVNCSNAPVTSGFVSVFLDGMNYRTNINNGNFSLTISRCNSNAATAQIVAVDQAGGQQSNATPLPVTSGNANAGQLSACGTSIIEFFNFTIDGNNHSYTPPSDSLTIYHADSSSTAVTMIMGYNGTSNMNLKMQGFAVPGPHPGMIRIAFQNNAVYEGGNFTVNVTQFGGVNQFVEGNFTTTVTKSPGGTTHNLSASFKVRRK